MAKIIVSERIAYIYMYQLEGTLSDILNALDNAVKKVPQGYTNIRFSWEYRYDDAKDLILEADRPETDAEYAERIEQEKNLKDGRRQQFLQLKKEFEG